LVTIAILGYLLFSALFVGIGATMTDVSSAGQFHGMVLMLPFLPFIFIGPVLANPSGLFAQIVTYIPFKDTGVFILCLTILVLFCCYYFSHLCLLDPYLLIQVDYSLKSVRTFLLQLQVFCFYV